MPFLDAIRSGFEGYVNFRGRSSRPQYWFFFLFILIAQMALQALYDPLGAAFAIATFVPFLAVAVRRLHDSDRSGWWLLVGLIPVIGWIVNIVQLCRAGTPGPNRFGDMPVAMTIAR
jgi:uncharacterized membrane protein YhaH (DUF805 family)